MPQLNWKGFAASVGAELRPNESIRGASGLDHPTRGVCIDEKRNRLIVLSAEPNPRVAALMQVDVQSTMPKTKVLVARPIVIDVGEIARTVFETAERARFSRSDVEKMGQELAVLDKEGKQTYLTAKFKIFTDPIAESFKKSPLDSTVQMAEAVQQLAHFDWGSVLSVLREGGPDDGYVDLSPLFKIDNLAIDRANGICPLPLYELNGNDWETLQSGSDVENITDKLKDWGVYQYFFPPEDQLVLGLIDRGIGEETQIEIASKIALQTGHPFDKSELIVGAKNIREILAAAKDCGYLAEGEFGFELSESGLAARQTVKFRPREGLISKLINRLNLNISASPKDFLPPH